MKAETFAIWLRGYLEISQAKTINESELKVIKEHLDKLFVEVAPVNNKRGLNHVNELQVSDNTKDLDEYETRYWNTYNKVKHESYISC